MATIQLTQKQRDNGFICSGEQVKAKLARKGKTLKQWANENNFDEDTVYKVVAGTRKGYHGIGHQIAVAIGMKQQPEEA